MLPVKPERHDSSYLGKTLREIWSSETLVDTCLSMLSSGLKFIWTNPTEMLVSPGSVVEHIDVV